jgi:hypothetical protein
MANSIKKFSDLKKKKTKNILQRWIEKLKIK